MNRKYSDQLIARVKGAFIAGLSRKLIASLTGIPDGAVASILYRGHPGIAPAPELKAFVTEWLKDAK